MTTMQTEVLSPGIRVICVESDGDMAYHLGGTVVVRPKTFDLTDAASIKAMLAWLEGCPPKAMMSRHITGVEVLPKGGE